MVEITVGQPGSPVNTTSVTQAIAGTDESFQVAIPTPRGHTIVTVTVIAGSHASGWEQQAVLVGEIRDQAHLYGRLDRLRDCGIDLVAVEPADSQP